MGDCLSRLGIAQEVLSTCEELGRLVGGSLLGVMEPTAEDTETLLQNVRHRVHLGG